MRSTSLVSAALFGLALSTTGCMLSPENGLHVSSIFAQVPFTVTSVTQGGNYVIETAQLDVNDNVIGWHFLQAGTTDTLLGTDVDGRTIYYDQKSSDILIGWKAMSGAPCGGPNCYKVRIRTRVKTPTGTWVPAKTFEKGSLACQADAWPDGADAVITQCARAQDWVEIWAW